MDTQDANYARRNTFFSFFCSIHSRQDRKRLRRKPSATSLHAGGGIYATFKSIPGEAEVNRFCQSSYTRHDACAAAATFRAFDRSAFGADAALQLYRFAASAERSTAPWEAAVHAAPLFTYARTLRREREARKLTGLTGNHVMRKRRCRMHGRRTCAT